MFQIEHFKYPVYADSNWATLLPMTQIVNRGISGRRDPIKIVVTCQIALQSYIFVFQKIACNRSDFLRVICL